MKNNFIEKETKMIARVSEVDTQVTTARAYPRDLARARKVAMDLALVSVSSAEQCIYALPVDKKTIHGPSIRMAEILAYAWGNMHIGGRIAREESQFVVSEGAAWDLENNVRSIKEVSRRITYKDGKRYNEHMIILTGNAAVSIALRNAILTAIPRIFWDDIYEEVCKKALTVQSSSSDTAGKVSVAGKRAELIDKFADWGVSVDRILLKFSKDKIEDLNKNDVIGLASFYKSIDCGDLTIDEAFSIQKSPSNLDDDMDYEELNEQK